MTDVNPQCLAFRIEWLEAGRSEGDHAAGCDACAAWARSAERSRAALATLVRPDVPPELEARVVEELVDGRSRRLQRILESSVRRSAPPLLDERIHALLCGVAGSEERGEHRAQALRALDVQFAPEVLERLLNEELAAPERHRVERFSGSLERLEAPAVLGQRVGETVRRNALTRLVLGPLLTLVAAGLVLWFSADGRDEQRSYRFHVTQASSLSDLDPMARAIAESLGGSPGELGAPR